MNLVRPYWASYAVRSDESTHRFVNHALANLKYEADVNPFAFGKPDMHTKGTKLGFERSEADTYVEPARKQLEKSEKDNNPGGN